MPELPEVETICRGLKPALEEKKIVRVDLHRENLRYPFPKNFKQVLESQKIRLVLRRSKYVLIELYNETSLVIHLGMSGRIKIIQPGSDNPGDSHDHVVIFLNTGAKIVYHDPRRFGFMDVFNEKAYPSYLLRLGVEPLGNEFNSEYLAGKWRGKKASLKAALLDQTIIAGLGNIYVLEALFRTGLSPYKKAGDLVRADGRAKTCMEALVSAIKEVLRDAIRSGGSTLKDYQKSDGSMGYFQHQFQVYGREGGGCFKQGCNGNIIRKTQNGRSSFYCPQCQK